MIVATRHPHRRLACLASALLLLSAAAAPGRAQNSMSFSPSEAGKGRKCYFGECADNKRAAEPAPNTRSEPPPPPTPTPTPSSLPPPAALNYADELSDFGVPPQSFLRAQVGAPTPTTIPSGRVVTTDQLRAALQSGRREFILIDALNAYGHRTIPGAFSVPLAGTGGTFDDLAQMQVFGTLSQLTGGRVDYPLVFFCEGARCWESYNAALRAINMGFSNVYWYRGGIDAWQQAGLPMSAGN